MRKLASVQVIRDLRPISGADVIELALVNGWQTVVKKGELSPGDRCVYFEIDSWLPASDERFAFLMARGTKVYEGVEGVRLRTLTLRGALSQGLAIPLSKFPELEALETETDVTAALGVVKWERPDPPMVAGQPAGAFPHFIPKTDQERVQNIWDEISQLVNGELDVNFEVTMKLEGSSMTAFHLAGRDDELGPLGVCSRSLEIKLTCSPDESTYVRAFQRYALGTRLSRYFTETGRNIALQGELMGPGVQGNIEGFRDARFYVYDIYDIDAHRYMDPEQRRIVLLTLNALDAADEILHVPVLHEEWSGRRSTLERILAMADGPSINAKLREGIVFKATRPNDAGRIFSFKAISNSYLLSEK